MKKKKKYHKPVIKQKKIKARLYQDPFHFKNPMDFNPQEDLLLTMEHHL